MNKINSSPGTNDEQRTAADNSRSASLVQNGMLVAAFPGTGKSYYCSNGNWSQYVPEKWCTDSDSSKFDKVNFPANYIEHIKEKIKQGYARIFISSHKEVRDALVRNGLKFTLVYPKENLKEEYLKRYKERGSNQAFIDLIDKNWSNWLFELHRQTGCTHIELESGQFISNVM